MSAYFPSDTAWDRLNSSLRLPFALLNFQDIDCLLWQKQKILYLFSVPGVTKVTLMLFIGGNNWANLLFLLK